MLKLIDKRPCNIMLVSEYPLIKLKIDKNLLNKSQWQSWHYRIMPIAGDSTWQ